MDGSVTGVFRSPEQAAGAVRQLRSLGFEGDAVQIDEKKGGLLEALLPTDERSDETRVTVKAGDHGQQVRQILQRNGALNVEGDGVRPAASTDGPALPLAAEELLPRTTVVQVGEVIVRKVVVTELRTFEVPVRREEIVVERSVLNEPLAAPAGNRFAEPITTESGETESTGLGADEEVIRIPILEEQVTVEKHPVVREEVRVLKRRVQEVVTLSEEIRREEPSMEIASEQPRQYQ
jgi:stress response protein YsnF